VEIDVSIARVAFHRARSAEIDASIARLAFHRSRNAEINASIARVKAQRIRAFEEARNAEINASIARVKVRRVLLETGTVSLPDNARRAETTEQAAPSSTAQALAAIFSLDIAKLLDPQHVPWAAKSQP